MMNLQIIVFVLEIILAIVAIAILLHIPAERNKADERMRIMFNAMPFGAIIHDKNFNYFNCNEGAINLFGLSGKQEYLEKLQQLSPEYQPDGSLSSKKMDEHIDRALIDGYRRFEWMHQKLNGEPIPCEITLVRVKHINEFTLAAYIRDLRELKSSIKQMNESEKSLNILSNIMNGMDAMIFVTVPDTGEILFMNDQMRKNFNIKDDAIGQTCYKVFQSGMDGICDFCPCRRLDKEPGSTVVWEMHNTLTNRIYQSTDRYIEWPDGRTVHIQHSIDVTELIAAKEQAEQSSRSKNQFLSRMSHEIRTPMNTILGITEIQLENKDLTSDVKDAFGEIYNSGYLLLGIINDILDISKIEAGKLELSPTTYDVPSLINDTVNLIIIQYDSKPIKFSLHVDENIPSKLYGDELRIKQILNNLLSNAFKYTDEGEVSFSVAVEYAPQGAKQITLVFSVEDTGRGMTREQLYKLFDEYTRFDTEANRTTEGTGLGMNITKQLVDMMDGEISVESEHGKGSAFIVRLPQKTVGARILGTEVAENLRKLQIDKAGQKKKGPRIVREYMPYGRVLIVDDVETNLYVARGLMAPYGLSVETATSGFAAIDKIKGGATFDIIFMDHFMPKMDGIETVKIIRDLDYTRPIVALTANALAGQEEVFLKNGFNGFISKPIDIRQLNILLNAMVRDMYPPEVVEAARQLAFKIDMEKYTEAVQPACDPELAAIFARDAEKALGRLELIHKHAYRRTDDIRSYIIDLHAMKSALDNIGETELSNIALKLEQAGRAEDIPVLMSGTPAFLEALRKVIEKNKPKEDDGDVSEQDSVYDRAHLEEKLLVIQKACEEYDEKTASTVLGELKQKKWPRSVKEVLDAIAEHLLHSDFEEAANLAKA